MDGTLLQKDISKIQASEMKFLRAVKGFSLRAVSYTHLDVYKRQHTHTHTHTHTIHDLDFVVAGCTHVSVHANLVNVRKLIEEKL